MTKHTPTEPRYCDKIVYGGNAPWGGARCSNKAKVEHGGKWYCGVHSPEGEARRKQRQHARWAEERARNERRLERLRVREAREKACVAAFHSNEGREIKTEKIEAGLFWRMRDLIDWTAQHDCECEDNTEFMCVPCEARALLAKLEE